MDHATSSASVRTPERTDRAHRTHDVLDRMVDTEGPSREALVEELIEINMPVAQAVARRYRHRGIPVEDLEQVAYLALVRVANAFDSTRGHDFLSYAVPSMRGEVRRYFRDQGWMVRPPRGIQEMQGRITSVESELASRLGHPPTSREIAEALDEELASVEEARAANGCFTPTSLDQAPENASSSIADQLGDDELGMDAAEARVVLQPVVRRLPERDRRILELRFFGQLTQQEIADDIGVTQMQVSRLLSSLMGRLRAELETTAPQAPQTRHRGSCCHSRSA